MDAAKLGLVEEDGIWWHYFKGGRRTKALEFECESCGKTFRSWHKDAVFCSVECRRASRRLAPKEVSCTGCGNKFFTKRKKNFCSHSCAASYMHRSRPVTTAINITPINADDAHYSKDENGQWWYSEKSGTRTRATILECGGCGKHFLTSVYHVKKTEFCSKQCAAKIIKEEGRWLGEKSGNWKGGRNIQKTGYVKVYAPWHPNHVGGYVLEHRLVMEKMLGRYLLPNETPHHLNGDRSDNRPENLQLWSRSQVPGQRVSDLIDYVATHHKDAVLSAINGKVAPESDSGDNVSL